MRDFFFTLCGTILVVYGVLSLITPFMNPERIRWFGDTTDFVYEKLFGKSGFNTFKNVAWGFISLVMGILITLYYGQQIIN